MVCYDVFIQLVKYILFLALPKEFLTIKPTTTHVRQVNFKINWIFFNLAKAILNFHDLIASTSK